MTVLRVVGLELGVAFLPEGQEVLAVFPGAGFECWGGEGVSFGGSGLGCGCEWWW